MSSAWIAAFAALTGLVAVLTLITLGLLREVLSVIEGARSAVELAQSRMRVFGLPAGSRVPSFAAEAADRTLFTERDLVGMWSVMLFVGSGCSGCARLLGSLSSDTVASLNAQLTVVVDEVDSEALEIARASGVTALLQRNGSVARVFESDRVPHAFVIDDHGHVRSSASPDSWDEVRELLSAGRGGEMEQSSPAALSTAH